MKSSIRLFKSLLVLLLLVGCTQCLIDPCYFAQVPIGEPIENVVDCVGCPYDICDNGYGEQRYIYINRWRGPHGFRRFRYYVFTVEDGIITDKCSTTEEHQKLFFEERWHSLE